MENILITGCTGSVGFNLIRKLLETTDSFLYLLIRSNKRFDSITRFNLLLEEKYDKKTLENYKNRFEVISGDVTEENFSIEQHQIEDLAKKINCIYHCAASISFTLPLQEARRINLIGTKNVLKFTEECMKFGEFSRLNHISTSYVLGDYDKVFFENQLNVGQNFENTYEQSKFETEELVNEYMKDDFPITIFRPSIIGSDYKTGEITKTNIIFDFIKRLSKGRLRQFLCDDKSSINLVPMDFVIDSLLVISQNEKSIGKVYHLSNITNISVKDLVTYICKCANSPIPEFVQLKERDRISKMMLMRFTPFIPYISVSHMFDNENTINMISNNVISHKLDINYIQRCINYCKANNLLA